MRALTSAMIAAAGIGTAAAVALVAGPGPARHDAASGPSVTPTTTAAQVHPPVVIVTTTPKPATPPKARKPHRPKRGPKPAHGHGAGRGKGKVKGTATSLEAFSR